MREVHGGHLWLGHAGDLWRPGVFEEHRIEALVHLALEERLPDLSRELLVCHFPLRDGANSQVLLTAALDMATSLIRTRTPTLICCSAGMSRTPAIAAGALALATGEDPTECLRALTTDAACDVSPMLWESVLNNVQERRGS